MIYLVRHGETVWNVDGRQQGHQDSPLTPVGIEQAGSVGRVLRQRILYSNNLSVETSPLGRARETAAIIASEIGVDPDRIVISPLLIEHNWGEWQGLTWEEIEEKYPGAWQARESDKWRYVVPGGDSYEQLTLRTRRWLEGKLLAPITIAVTHEMISRTIRGSYIGLPHVETLRLSHRHDRIYSLNNGKIEEFC
jgi:broad specificity phosphatase PhoE